MTEMMRSVSVISDYYLCVSARMQVNSSLKYTKWPGICLLGHLTPLCTLSLPAPALTRQRPLHSLPCSVYSGVSRNQSGTSKINTGTKRLHTGTRYKLAVNCVLLNHASQRLIVHNIQAQNIKQSSLYFPSIYAPLDLHHMPSIAINANLSPGTSRLCQARRCQGCVARMNNTDSRHWHWGSD